MGLFKTKPKESKYKDLREQPAMVGKESEEVIEPEEQEEPEKTERERIVEWLRELVERIEEGIKKIGEL